MEQPVVLPIRLQPSNLRPLAYRILSKKHGLNIKSDALRTLADFIGPKFGVDWKAAKSQMFLEEVARLWKEQERGLFLDSEGLEDVLKELDALESKTIRDSNSHQQVSMDAFLQKNKDAAERRDTVVDVDAMSDGEDDLMTATQTSPATSVTPPPLRETFDWREYFKLISAFEQPLFDYNHQRKQYEFATDVSSFHGATIDASVQLHRRRYHILRDRLLRNENFQTGVANPYSSFTTPETSGTITQIKNLLGRNNQQFLLLGMLTSNNGGWQLEDPSDSIQINIDETEPNDGLFYTPGNIVLCDGVYSGGIFYVTSMGHPPAEKRQETLEAVGNIDFLGIHANLRVDKEIHTRLRLLEREYDHKLVILGSDCFLDDLRTLDAVDKLLLKLSEDDENNLAISIVFNGSFASTPLPSAEYKGLFDSLAEVLEKHPIIAGNVSLIFIPGENDHWQTPVWPRQKIPKLFGNRLNRVARSVQWASNPTRMVYLAQELVFTRDDIGSRFRRNSVVFPLMEKKEEDRRNGMDADNDNEEDDDIMNLDERVLQKSQIDRIESLPLRVSEARKLVKTVLDQGHLSPFTKSLKPVVWHLDHTLHLSPLPNVLVMSDPTTPAFDVTYNGCKCLNAGSLITKRKINYIEYLLTSKKAEIKELYF